MHARARLAILDILSLQALDNVSEAYNVVYVEGDGHCQLLLGLEKGDSPRGARRHGEEETPLKSSRTRLRFKQNVLFLLGIIKKGWCGGCGGL